MFRNLSLFVLFGLMVINPTSYPSDLDLEPAALFKCWRALKKLNTRETPLIPTDFVTKINSTSVKKIFDSSSKSDLKARGLGYRSIDGTLKVLFWPLSSDSSNQQISFRDAIESILKQELKAIENYLSKPKNEKLNLLLDAKENLAHLLKELKTNENIPPEITERFFGFQLNAREPSKSSDLTVQTIEFDPLVNGKSNIGSLFGWKEDFQVMIDAISKSIASDYTPKEFRVSPELLESYPLRVPKGSKITSFSEK